MRKKTWQQKITVRANYEDDELKADIRAILVDLPADSPPVLAMIEDKTSIEIMRVIPSDRSDLLDRLQVAHFAWVRRCFERAFRHSPMNPQL